MTLGYSAHIQAKVMFSSPFGRIDGGIHCIWIDGRNEGAINELIVRPAHHVVLASNGLVYSVIPIACIDPTADDGSHFLAAAVSVNCHAGRLKEASRRSHPRRQGTGARPNQLQGNALYTS
jgi:hypothetical protein